MTTHYVQIEHDQRKFEPDGWTPWYNCTDSFQDTALLALNKFLREAGYQSSREQDAPRSEPFDVMVYVTDDKSPRHANGRFLACHGFRMRVTPN
jgi:hypothetical protein